MAGETFADYAKRIRDGRRFVIKIGSDVLRGWQGRLSQKKVADICDQVGYLVAEKQAGVMLVSSGAILTGQGTSSLKIPESLRQGMDEKQEKTALEQAYAAIGQPVLCSEYSRAIRSYKLPSGEGNIIMGQCLVTDQDFSRSPNKENTKNTLEILLHNNIVPDINENDTTSTYEITVGDNDRLSALVGIAMGADAVIKLTTKRGVMNYSGRSIKQCGRSYDDRSLVEVVDDIASMRECEAIKSEMSKNGRGGMGATLNAAEKLQEHNIPYFIIDGREENAVLDMLDGKLEGTVFVPERYKE